MCVETCVLSDPGGQAICMGRAVVSISLLFLEIHVHFQKWVGWIQAFLSPILSQSGEGVAEFASSNADCLTMVYYGLLRCRVVRMSSCYISAVFFMPVPASYLLSFWGLDALSLCKILVCLCTRDEPLACSEEQSITLWRLAALSTFQVSPIRPNKVCIWRSTACMWYSNGTTDVHRCGLDCTEYCNRHTALEDECLICLVSSSSFHVLCSSVFLKQRHTFLQLVHVLWHSANWVPCLASWGCCLLLTLIKFSKVKTY